MLKQNKMQRKFWINKTKINRGAVLNGPSRFWWKGKEVDMNYFYVMGFTIDKNRETIEKKYSEISKEKIPMASFIKMDGNEEFLNYIYDNIK